MPLGCLTSSVSCQTLLFFFKRFYLFIHERHTERGRDTGRGREMGLDPRTPRSRPEPKADAQPLSHPGVPSVPPDFNMCLASCVGLSSHGGLAAEGSGRGWLRLSHSPGRGFLPPGRAPAAVSSNALLGPAGALESVVGRFNQDFGQGTYRRSGFPMPSPQGP